MIPKDLGARHPAFGQFFSENNADDVTPDNTHNCPVRRDLMEPLLRLAP